MEDAWMWKHTTSGQFSVKSAHFMELLDTRKNLPSGSSVNRDGAWKKLWSIQVPPKVKMFGWKILHNGLPVRANLVKRGLKVAPVCPRCGEDAETVEHMLMYCPGSQRDGKRRKFVEIVDRAVRGTIEYERGNSAAAPKDITLEANVKWRALAERVYKVNTNAAMFEGNKIGMGGVVRDFKGDVVVAVCGILDGVDNVDVAEALIGHQGVTIALEVGFSNLILEVDSMKLFVHLKDGRMECSPFGKIVQDIRLFAAKCSNVAYNHVKRQGNVVAHKLAKFCKSIDCMLVWLEEVPPEIVNSVIAEKFPE